MKWRLGDSFSIFLPNPTLNRSCKGSGFGKIFPSSSNSGRLCFALSNTMIYQNLFGLGLSIFLFNSGPSIFLKQSGIIVVDV